MNWMYLLIGIAFIIGAFLLYKGRKWDFFQGDNYDAINKMRLFNTWLVIVLVAIMGLALILKAL